jgi:hypothetical protein
VAPVPNPGSAGGTFDIKITQSWSQETNYDRTGSIKVPATTAGQKLPLVVDLHGERLTYSLNTPTSQATAARATSAD